jgi:hypothetical protein
VVLEEEGQCASAGALVFAEGIFGRTEARCSEGKNGGRRRSFIDTLRIDAPLDGAVINLMSYTWRKG